MTDSLHYIDAYGILTVDTASDVGKKHMSIEAFGNISPNQTIETSQSYDQPLDTPDAPPLPQQESYDSHDRSVLYLSSAAIIAHERVLLSQLQAEVAALAEEVRQADIVLANIAIDFRYVDEQISDLGRPGVPQMTMRRDLEIAHQAATAQKASLVARHRAKVEEVNAIRSHQERRDWALSDDY